MRTVKGRTFWIGACVIIAVIALCAIYVGPSVWTPLCCKHEHVDIKTGRIRHTQYLLYCRISERIEDSILTKALSPESLEGVQADWRHVNTFSPGLRRSPHYAYHSAIHQIGMLKMAWEMTHFSDEAKREVAETLLRAWQSDGSDRAGGDYMDEVCDLAIETIDSNSTVGTAELDILENKEF